MKTNETRETGEAWDVVAMAKYRAEFEEHVARLRAGEDNLLSEERDLLGGLLVDAHVIHLQCSHGLDALGLLNAGAASVVGIDISVEMIAQARAKAEALGWSHASFVVADAVEPPPELAGSADLVYTGRGSLPWMLELEPWARAAGRLLKPQGHLFVFEGHPLANLWVRDDANLRLRDEVGYFDEVAREAPGFPASVVERAVGPDRPLMRERHWRPGQIIEALLDAGFELLRFKESPTLFWDQFPRWPATLRGRLPNSYALLARSSGRSAT